MGGGIIGPSIAWNLAKSGLTSELIVIEPDPTYEFAATPRAIGGIRFVQGLIENLKCLSTDGMFLKTSHANLIFKRTLLT